MAGHRTDSSQWVRLREEFARFDAEKMFDVAGRTAEEPAECISALVLQGLKKPLDCPAFGGRCTPVSPLGAPMVSGEGACAAYYQYKRHKENPRSEVPNPNALAYRSAVDESRGSSNSNLGPGA